MTHTRVEPLSPATLLAERESFDRILQGLMSYVNTEMRTWRQTTTLSPANGVVEKVVIPLEMLEGFDQQPLVRTLAENYQTAGWSSVLAKPEHKTIVLEFVW